MKAIQLVRNRVPYPSLAQEARALKHRLPELKVKFMGKRMIELRDVTKKELKHEIRKLFSNGQTLYYSDIAEQLGVDLKSVVDVCRELQENKEIGVDDSAPARTL